MDHFINPKSHITNALGDQADFLREKAFSANRQIENPPNPYESWFELDVALMIATRGYRVIPQYPTIENKRIDLVVEGEISKLAVECDGDRWHGPDEYEKDMDRQRRLERAGWEFFRVRGSVFSADPESSLEPLWLMLREHKIYPVGEQSSSFRSDRAKETDKNTGEDKTSNSTARSNTETTLEVTKATSNDQTKKHTLEEKELISSQNISTPKENSNILINKDSYVEFNGSGLKDPMTADKIEIAEGLCLIVQSEGPMLAKKAYDVYLRTCGIQRLGSQLQKTMNTAMQYAINHNKIDSEDELKKGGLIYSIVRTKNSPPIILRDLGSRAFDEIPPSELQVVSQIIKQKNEEFSEEEHIRAVLKFYDLVKLTPTRESLFKKANEVSLSYVNNYKKESS